MSFLSDGKFFNSTLWLKDEFGTMNPFWISRYDPNSYENPFYAKNTIYQ